MNSINRYDTFQWKLICPEWLQLTVEKTAALFGLQPGGATTDCYLFVLEAQDKGRGASLVSFSVYDYRGTLLAERVLPCESTLKTMGKHTTALVVLQTLHALLPDVPLPPWGVLQGIRPGKLATRLLAAGKTADEAIASLMDHYSVSHAKAMLAVEIAVRQRPLLAALSEPRSVSVYISVPFCPSRCLYCSFPSAVRPGAKQVKTFLQAVGHDLAAVVKLLTRFNLSVKTVYIGGGTPTVLTDEEFDWLLNQVVPLLSARTAEFTVEAGRPDTFSLHKLAAMAAQGVTRISLNPQTMQDRTLRLIGRAHTAQDVRNQMKEVRRIGIASVNMDLIAGLPGETVSMFQDTLEQTLAFAPENLTVHTLALKRRSPLFALGEAALASSETVAQMVDLSLQETARSGWHPYYLYRQHYITGNLENVGYAKAGFESLYNVQMMEEWQTVIGVGPSAVTKLVLSPGRRMDHYFMPKDSDYYAASIERLVCAREALLTPLYGV